MAIDVSTNSIYEGELQDVDSMSEVTHVRVITPTGSGSEKVPIYEFKLPASQINNGSSVAGATVDDALTQLNTAKAADNSVVHSTGNETVEGVKTFTDSPIVPNPTTSTQADNKGSRDAADNDLRLELFSESIGSVYPQAQDKPTPPTNRRYRFSESGDCIFEGVTFENTGTEMEVPFPVLKDDELFVTVFGDQYYYKFFQIASKEMVARTDADNALQQQIDTLGTDMGNISSALDEILLIGGGI